MPSVPLSAKKRLQLSSSYKQQYMYLPELAEMNKKYLTDGHYFPLNVLAAL
jgi:hypothetical protein